MALNTSPNERLQEALGIGPDSDVEAIRAAAHRLAEILDVTYQAAMKAITSTGALSSKNNAIAALSLNVSHYWLATGRGDMRDPPAWPFPEIERSRFERLKDYQKTEIQGLVRERIEKFESPPASDKSLADIYKLGAKNRAIDPHRKKDRGNAA